MSQAKGPTSLLSPTEMVKEIMELKRQLGSMQENAGAIALMPKTHYKVVPPEPFNGTRGKLQVFLT